MRGFNVTKFSLKLALAVKEFRGGNPTKGRNKLDGLIAELQELKEHPYG